MKNRKLILFFGVLITLVVLWKGCRSETAKQSSAARESRLHGGTKETENHIDELQRYVKRGNVPISFYGKVIDENGVGLPGVSVEYRIQRGEANAGAVKVHRDPGMVVSEAGGNFEVLKEKGTLLALGPFVKEGFRNAQPEGRSFGYMGTSEPHVPDARNPVQFVMVTEAAPRTEDLGHKTLKFAWNRGEVRIPLGDKLGDFVLVPSRLLAVGERRDFDWSVGVSMDGAELVELGEYHALIAPSEGYQESFEYGSRKGDPKWLGGLQVSFAFKTVDERYGLARLVVYPGREDFVVNGALDVSLNQSGSRNLD